jgi:hypothetical protein
MGFLSNILGKIWVKHLFKDPNPRYGKNKDQTFRQVVSEANETINRCKAGINQNCDEIAELWVKDDVYTRMQVIKEEYGNNTEFAWKVWWNIRYIEATCGVKRQLAHETVRDMIRQGKPLKDSDECQGKLHEMIVRGEETVHV